MKSFAIGSSTIGDNQPTYVIAEIGINHNGDLDRARRLVEAAAHCRADAVKFQKRRLQSLYPREVIEETHRFEQHFQYMIPILKQVELSEDAYRELKQQAEDLGLDFLCTPFDEPSFRFLETLGVPAYKIASADLTNIPHLETVASAGKPMIVSTGMSYWDEIETAVEVLRRAGVPFAFLHCRSVYPVWAREVNLKMMLKLKQFGCPVGYSSHDVGITVSLVAASMGASIIEKHLTLDKTLAGPDHKVSLEPFEFRRLVRDIRVADQALGKSKRFLLQGEILNREVFAKSIVASQTIPRGAVIQREMLDIRGPGKGLAPCRLPEVVGAAARRDFQAGEMFTEEDVSGPTQGDFTNAFRSLWGLIARFGDADTMASFNPKVLEFHLAEQDLEIGFTPNQVYGQGLVVHAPEYLGERLLDLCTSDEDLRGLSVEQVRKSTRLAVRLSKWFQGKPKVIVHPGAMSINEKLPRDPLRRNLCRSWEQIQTDEVELLMENLPPYPWYFGGQWKGNYFMDTKEILEFCERTGAGFCFDLSHAALYCNAKDRDLTKFTAELKPHIRHIHFADGYGLDGEGVQIGEGEIDFDAVMPLFEDYRGSWVPEVWRGHLNQARGFLEALKRLSKYDL